MIYTPFLTEEDRAESSEGSIDPLGLYPIADSLAVKLIPGIRERQKHPRFLTVIAVSLVVNSEFEEGTVARDGVSEPWQVFEWYIVEGLVRSIPDRSFLTGLPGVEKAAKAISDSVPLSSHRYLKNPSVFGFHGVYRVLSRELKIDVGGYLGDTGYELISLWSRENNITGFIGTDDGPGKKWRKILKEAVDDGLKKGKTDRSWAWNGWQFFGDHLIHTKIGSNEADLIKGLLLRQGEGFRGEILNFLVSSEGCNIWTESNYSERKFHEYLIKIVNEDLQKILNAIMVYEYFSRLLTDAFNDCLYRMTQIKGKTKIEDLIEMAGVKKATQKTSEVFQQMVQLMEPFADELLKLKYGFIDFGNNMPIDQWVENLLEHHKKIQQNKPPDGKSVWFERFDDGSYIIRPLYYRDKGGTGDTKYVQAYRTSSLWSFAHDLNMVR